MSKKVHPPAASVPESFLRELHEHIAFRRINDGIQLLRKHQEFIDLCGPKQKNSAVFIGQLAQWIDIGFAQPKLLAKLLARFPANLRGSLPIRSFVHLELAEGFVLLSEQQDEKAIQRLKIVTDIQHEIQAQDLIEVANFWIGRCYRRLSRYHDALGYSVKAREAATRSKHSKTVGVIQVLEGWILFQEGDTDEAMRILGLAEEVLLDTDDYVARGKLNSTYSRIARRKGDWEEALRRSEMAIQEFKKRDEQHRNLARSLVNNAFVKRLLALELGDKIDSELARTRKTPGKNSSPPRIDTQHDRKCIKDLREEAIRDLIDAGAIFSSHHDYRGEGDVLITYGYLHLDDGDFDLASSKAVAAYRLGEERKDAAFKTRSRSLQSSIESAKVDEQIVEGAGSRRSSRLAVQYAREALESAKTTQNRQLILEALLTLGAALVNDGDIDEAHGCCDQAATLIAPDNRDYAWKQLRILRKKLNNVGGIESMFREWSRGSVGNKTFRQITEDFAAIVIPKVWRHEGSKISRVAARLSISPKKVRRILRSQGILGDTDSTTTITAKQVAERGKGR